MKSYPNRYTNKIKLQVNSLRIHTEIHPHTKNGGSTSKEKVMHQTEIYPFRNCMSTNVFKNSKKKNMPILNLRSKVKVMKVHNMIHRVPILVSLYLRAKTILPLQTNSW